MKTLNLTCKKTITLRQEDIELYKEAETLCGMLSDIDIYRRGLASMVEERQTKKD